jgi:decaprenylphospho-beta-D-erythro-pentofuranosid-2-ulose 2-reductase
MATVLILGATSDIGCALARKYASKGYAVQLAGRNLPQLNSISADISIRYGVACSVHKFDALDFDGHSAFYDALPVKPDSTICVMGYMQDNEISMLHAEETLRTIHTNYSGAVSVLNIVAADYRQRKKGSIIGISSVAGERGRQSNFIYGSAKAGFSAYLSGLRNLLYHHGVHVMTVLPGFVNTQMTEHLALPQLLTAQPMEVANQIFVAAEKRKNVLYVKWFWRFIMQVIKLIPEPVFKRARL